MLKFNLIFPAEDYKQKLNQQMIILGRMTKKTKKPWGGGEWKPWGGGGEGGGGRFQLDRSLSRPSIIQLKRYKSTVLNIEGWG